MLQVNISYFTASDFNYLYGGSDGAHPACTLKLMFTFVEAATCNHSTIMFKIRSSPPAPEWNSGQRQGNRAGCWQAILLRFVKSFVTGLKTVSDAVMLTNKLVIKWWSHPKWRDGLNRNHGIFRADFCCPSTIKRPQKHGTKVQRVVSVFRWIVDKK